LLKDLRVLTLKKGVSLVLHGASGLPHELVQVRYILSIFLLKRRKTAVSFH